MRRRSKVAFKQVEKSALEGAEKAAENAEDITRLEMLRSLAADHNVLGNKLNSIAKRMNTNTRCKENKERYDENVRINDQTLLAYHQQAEQATKKKELSEEKSAKLKPTGFASDQARLKTTRKGMR